MTELRITVGMSERDIRAMARENDRRAQAGELTEDVPEIINFQSWEHLTSVLSPKRLELLRYVHRNPTASINQLANALGRKYPNVHADVQALVDAGLLENGENGLRAEYDEVTTRMAM